MQTDPRKRPTAEDILHSKIIQQFVSSTNSPFVKSYSLCKTDKKNDKKKEIHSLSSKKNINGLFQVNSMEEIAEETDEKTKLNPLNPNEPKEEKKIKKIKHETPKKSKFSQQEDYFVKDDELKISEEENHNSFLLPQTNVKKNKIARKRSSLSKDKKPNKTSFDSLINSTNEHKESINETNENNNIQ